MSGLLSIGKTAMFANYAALQTAGNNIGNANTPGYSRQDVQLADAPGQYTGSGFFGRGVDVVTVTRAYDGFLTNQAVATRSTAAADAARLDKLTQLEGVFPLGSAGIGYAAGEFLNGFVDIANNPGDASARQVTLGQAQDVAARIRAAGDQIETLQRGVAQDVQSRVASLNTLAQQVAKLNQQIAALKGTGQPPNQMLDQRDALVAEIAATISVTTIQADDGSVGVFIGGGQSLVLGTTANTVKAVADPYDPTQVALSMAEGGVDRLIPADSLGGGSLAGLLRFQNDDLTAARNLLGRLAAAFSGSVNLQQSLGLDAGRPAAAGAPIFAVGAPRVLPATTNGGNAALSATVTDPAALQPSDYELRFDGSNYTLTRRSDRTAVAGSPFTPAQLAAGIQFDGVSLQIAAGTANAGDRFLIQPVATAAAGMRTVLSDPKGIAAAAPFTASVGAANSGTAGVASLVATDPSYDPTLAASIAFTSSTGDYTWTLSDGSTGTGTWTAATPISLNGFALTLDGVPASGDTVDLVPTVVPAANNGNALAFAQLASVGIVAAGAGGAAPMTITDAYASAIAGVGARVQGGKTAASISDAVASQAEKTRADQAGVNLDEEAAKLIQFQQSYQAAAKILQVAQTLFDTMLQAASR